MRNGTNRIVDSLKSVADTAMNRVADGIDAVGELIEGEKPKGKKMSNVVVVAEKGLVPEAHAGEVVVLEKGANLAIDPTVGVIGCGIEWDEVTTGPDFDADVSALIVYGNSKNELVYFGTPKRDGRLVDTTDSVYHTGDNLTGADDAVAGVDVNDDDETIYADLKSLPADVEKVIFFVNIYQAEEKKQNFGTTGTMKARLYNADNAHIFMEADLMEDNATQTSMIIGEFYRKDAAWKYKNMAQGGKQSLTEFANAYN